MSRAVLQVCGPGMGPMSAPGGRIDRTLPHELGRCKGREEVVAVVY